jgi:hypothetical protein
MPGIIQQILQGNFSAPLTLIFVFFSLLALYFLFRLGWLFFVRGDEFMETADGKRQAKGTVRLLIVCVLIAFFSGFVFQFLNIGRGVAEQNAPGVAQGFFNWLLGK